MTHIPTPPRTRSRPYMQCKEDLGYAIETLRYISNKVEAALTQDERATLADLANQALQHLTGD